MIKINTDTTRKSVLIVNIQNKSEVLALNARSSTFVDLICEKDRRKLGFHLDVPGYINPKTNYLCATYEAKPELVALGSNGLKN